MKKNKLFILCGIMFSVLIIGNVMAGVIPTTVGDNFISRIISDIKFMLHEQEMFTVYGREMECSIYPDTKVYLKNTLFGDKKFYFNQDTVCGSQSFFVNYYRGAPGSDQYLKEIYYKDGSAYVTDGDGQGSLYTSAYVQCDAGAYWDNNCYVEVYCCSQGACQSDSECGSNEECTDGHISSTFSQLGICKSTNEPTHTTKVYQCLQDGSSDFLNEVSSNSINWCSNPNKNNYLLPSGGTSGVCYTSANEPCYVPAPAPGEPDVGDDGEVDGETGKADSITASSIDISSSSVLADSVCSDKISCSSGSECIVIENLGLSDAKAKSLREDFCVAYGGGGAFTLKAFTDNSYFQACSALIGKQDYFKTSFGFCISDYEGGVKFLRDLAFFDITGDKNVDGAIILGGGILILILIMSRLNFVKEFEYEK